MLKFFLLLIPAAAIAQEPSAQDLKAFAPLPANMDAPSNPPTPAKIELGRMLYFENRLSRDHKTSCNSCHRLDRFGVDNEATSEGFKGQRGDRNSPTTFNAAGHFVQFWDGRAKTVEDQAKGPVLNPVEMAMPGEKEVLEVLRSIPGYVAAFAKAFPGEKDPITYDNFAKAVGAFERRLVTPARWDAYLKGALNALSVEEKRGFTAFVKTGCAACHNGPFLGGTSFQKLGAVKKYHDESDPGRFKETKKEADRMMFKVPSLRNIAKTAPYLHNGKVKTLEEMVGMMAEQQLGKKLAAADVKAIVAWMESLTGILPKEFSTSPALPPAGPKTPKPVMGD